MLSRIDTPRVKRTRILGTNAVSFTALVPSALASGHSTLTSFDDGTGWWGQVGTDRLPAELAALPGGSDERIARVREWHEEQYKLAYDLIIAAYPEAANGSRSMGEITIEEPNRRAASNLVAAPLDPGYRIVLDPLGV